MATRTSTELFGLPRVRHLLREHLLHPYFRGLAGGDLPEESFNFYHMQNCHFLPAYKEAFMTATNWAKENRLDGFLDLLKRLAKDVDQLLCSFTKHATSLDVNFCGPKTAATKQTVEFVSCKSCAPQPGGQSVERSIAELAARLAPFTRCSVWISCSLRKAGALETAGSYATWVCDYDSACHNQLADDIDALLDMSAEACFQQAQSEGDRAALWATLEDLYTSALVHNVAFYDSVPGLTAVEASGAALIRAARLVPPRVLIIAGSDSGGGAGIQADIKACTVVGVFSTTAVAALTAQNSQGVQGIFPVPVDFVKQQMRSVLDDLGTDVVKTGMLATSEIVTGVASALREGVVWPRKLVLDPVMVSTSGHILLPEDAIASVKGELFPMTTIVTPNLKEAQLLLGRPEIATVEAMEQAARDLCALGPRWALVKGGHLKEMQAVTGTAGSLEVAVDVLCDGSTGRCERFTSELIDTTHTHGTGCTLASSIAAFLASGRTVPESVAEAKRYVSGAIAASAHLALGSGPQGPMNHCWQTAEW